MKNLLIAAIAAGALSAGAAGAADIRIAPADFIVLNPTNPNAGYGDLVVHAVGVRAQAGERLHVDALRIEILAQGQVVLSETVPAARLLADTTRLAHAPVRGFMTGQLLDPSGPDGLFGAPTAFAASADLAPGEALFTVRQHFSVGFQPDQVRVIALAGADARPVAEASVPVRPYRSAIAYRFPLQGAWLMRAAPRSAATTGSIPRPSSPRTSSRPTPTAACTRATASIPRPSTATASRSRRRPMARW